MIVRHGDYDFSPPYSRALVETTEAISAHHDADTLLRDLACRLRKLIKLLTFQVTLYNAEGGTVLLHLIDPPETTDPRLRTEAPAEESPNRIVWQTQQPLIVSATSDGARFPNYVAWMRELGLQSEYVLPVSSAERRLGVIGFGSTNGHLCDESERKGLQLIAKEYAGAVDHLSNLRQVPWNFELIGSQAFLDIQKQIAVAAPTDSTILIRGETGSGKELVADAIHKLSGRRERKLVKVNCSAIPTGLLESEFFGHEKGAFTGAIAQRIGRFEMAHQGTLFLDEVGDIPRELQPKLLRVLQEKEFERLGGTKTIRVDVRLIAATNADLPQLVADKQFRADLYYRLNVFPLTVPALRERPEDIIPLAQRFAERFARRMNKRVEIISPASQQALVRYRWPGNIRELQNVIERAVILSQSPVLEVSLCELESKPEDRTLAGIEREYILRVLHETNWVVSGNHGAARRLGLNRSTLQSKMRKLGINRQDDR